jgi:hypothetical protein
MTTSESDSSPEDDPDYEKPKSRRDQAAYELSIVPVAFLMAFGTYYRSSEIVAAFKANNPSFLLLMWLFFVCLFCVGAFSAGIEFVAASFDPDGGKVPTPESREKEKEEKKEEPAV